MLPLEGILEIAQAPTCRNFPTTAMLFHIAVKFISPCDTTWKNNNNFLAITLCWLSQHTIVSFDAFFRRIFQTNQCFFFLLLNFIFKALHFSTMPLTRCGWHIFLIFSFSYTHCNHFSLYSFLLMLQSTILLSDLSFLACRTPNIDKFNSTIFKSFLRQKLLLKTYPNTIVPSVISNFLYSNKSVQKEPQRTCKHHPNSTF